MSRAIAVGYPHHITQRGNDRRTVFVEADDYLRYREWLARNARKFGLDIWAWCLMPNHVHVVGVPNSEDALSRTFNTVHMQYAQYHNRTTNASGHLWQGRYFSCVLDEAHVYAAVRYVEMNPVRGGLAASAQDYPWSSAKSHITGRADPVVSGNCFLTETVRDWGLYLAEAPAPAVQENIIKATATGRAHQCPYVMKTGNGSGDFIEFLRDTEPEWYKEPAEGLMLRPLEIHEGPCPYLMTLLEMTIFKAPSGERFECGIRDCTA